VRNLLEAVVPIKSDCPIGSLPGADQYPPGAHSFDMFEEWGTDAAPLVFRSHICMADQINITSRLSAHHAKQRAVRLVAQNETPAAISSSSSWGGMYGSCQQSAGDHTTICLGGSIYDLEDGGVVVLATRANVARGGHGQPPIPIFPAERGRGNFHFLLDVPITSGVLSSLGAEFLQLPDDSSP
jgi:hypothetical protein